MDLNEYKEKLEAIRKEADAKSFALAKEYALSHNTVKTGDIVKDHIGNVLVESIKIHLSSPPSCVYFGPTLTVKLAPTKNGKKREAYQMNLVT